MKGKLPCGLRGKKSQVSWPWAFQTGSLLRYFCLWCDVEQTKGWNLLQVCASKIIKSGLDFCHQPLVEADLLLLNCTGTEISHSLANAWGWASKSILLLTHVRFSSSLWRCAWHLINGSTFLSVPLCATHGTDLNFVCSQSACARLAYTESANKDGFRVIFFVMYLFFSCFWPGFVHKSCHVKLLCAGRVKIGPWQCLSSARLGGSEQGPVVQSHVTGLAGTQGLNLFKIQG